ncbi:hypothetical protein AWZ03_014197 [Drosophila navojoa]|uniref:DUF4758 domain-containing protein n=1 Tax=Drosophila navojoa TaxID=7232 RepID=A0A484AU30_DRONA|nr:uncharacterized protein LOC115565204 isoform X2 [Drosophila navojoa]TDG39380.1 hypothetical protein AWZ03_014197 [Drosophila navojoa]
MRKHCIYGCCILLLLLQLVSGEQQAEDHRIQRRFMWQQMDMGGLMGRMFGGARIMRSMFGDFMPSTASYSKNMMDYMPTETTRVKYIIRDPHTNKPVKIIKMRGSAKKVVKLIRPLPKPQPLVTESTKLQYENRMRQLEKEQELIAEGKAPASSDEALMDKYFKHKPRTNSNEIVSGKIMEYQSWKPVYKSGEQPTSYVTLRPQAMTQLHTQITSSRDNKDYPPPGEMLPKPEKLVGRRPELDEEDDDFEQVDDDNENELAKPPSGHQYEVTEHTGEASGEVQSLAPMEGGFVPSKQYHSQPSEQANSQPSSHSGSHSSSHSNSPPDSHANGQHSHSGSHAHRPRSRGNSLAPPTTTTTEVPNYPPAFLKKYREREAAAANAKPSSSSSGSSSSKSRPKHHKELILVEPQNSQAQSNISFAMSSLRARLQEQQRQTNQEERDAEMEAALVDAMHGDKWPAQVQHGGSYLTSPIGPSAVAFDQAVQPSKKQRSEYKRQRANLRQRGSVKFSDNPIEEV